MTMTASSLGGGKDWLALYGIGAWEHSTCEAAPAGQQVWTV